MEQDQNAVNHGKHKCYPLESKHVPLAPVDKIMIKQNITAIKKIN